MLTTPDLDAQANKAEPRESPDRDGRHWQDVVLPDEGI